jgi:deazaflavin-dependent oxidoreductase (nitroreductase family)
MIAIAVVALVAVLALAIVGFVALALLERLLPPDRLRTYQRLSMPLFRSFASHAPGWALIETLGRRTGRPRVVPIGGSLKGDEFWFLVGNPRRARYLRNIEANPRVRIRVRGRWFTGTACPLPDDDVRKRTFSISPINSIYLLMACREQQTVRVDLDRTEADRS